MGAEVRERSDSVAAAFPSAPAALFRGGAQGRVQRARGRLHVDAFTVAEVALRRPQVAGVPARIAAEA
jgi:hypothetical protein